MRYIAYRGEYGLTDQVLSTRLGSYTFSTQEAAQRYALHPNDARYQNQPINLLALTRTRSYLTALNDGVSMFQPMQRGSVSCPFA